MFCNPGLLQNKYFNRQRIDSVKAVELNIIAQEVITSNLSVRCYCLSDLHADAESNLQWVRQYCARSPADSGVYTVFILPGDIGSDIERIRAVLAILVENYDAVCYVPGNHEAWRKGGAASGAVCTDSVEKFTQVIDCAVALGVYVGPLRVVCNSGAGPAVVLMPLYAWYHSGWDYEPDLTHPAALAAEEAVPFARKWSDFYMCSWPAELLSHEEFIFNGPESTQLAEAFAKVNEQFLHPPPPLPSTSSHMALDSSSTGSVFRTSALGELCEQCEVLGSPLVRSGDSLISFSHFLPRVELCIEKRFLMEAGLAKVVGSDPLEAQVRRLQPHLHLFGHTHIPMDLELEGIRYIQWPLGYKREAAMQCAPIYASGPLMVHDTALGVATDGIPPDLASLRTKWTEHYRAHPREPARTDDLAPWVLQRLEAFGFTGPQGTA